MLTTNYDGTNVIVCGVSRFTGKPFCLTNPVAPMPRTNLLLSWTVPNWPAPIAMQLTNHLLWSTNSPAGPWTGDIPVVVTNNIMRVNVRINPALPALFFRLGTNL